MYARRKHQAPATIIALAGLGLAFVVQGRVPGSVHDVLRTLFLMTAAVFYGVGDLGFCRRKQLWVFSNHFHRRLMARLDSTPLVAGLAGALAMCLLSVWPFLFQGSSFRIPASFLVYAFVIPLFVHGVAGAVSISRLYDSLLAGDLGAVLDLSPEEQMDVSILSERAEGMKWDPIGLSLLFAALVFWCNPLSGFLGIPIDRIAAFVFSIAVASFASFMLYAIEMTNINNLLICLTWEGSADIDVSDAFENHCRIAKWTSHFLIFLAATLLLAFVYLQYRFFHL